VLRLLLLLVLLKKENIIILLSILVLLLLGRLSAFLCSSFESLPIVTYVYQKMMQQHYDSHVRPLIQIMLRQHKISSDIE
jgi:hypothetical protein